MELGARFLFVRSDPLLVVNKVTGVYQAKSDNMTAYLEEAKKMMKKIRRSQGRVDLKNREPLNKHAR